MARTWDVVSHIEARLDERETFLLKLSRPTIA